MWFTLSLILIGGFTALYLWVWRKFQYFAKIGVPADPAYFPLGAKSQWQLLAGKKGFNSMLDEVYLNNRDKPMIGYYGVLGDRFLVINDMDVIKDVLIKDFDYFADRRQFYFGDNEYMKKRLPILKGDQWKSMRSMTSPVFTSGKLKGMVPLIDQVP